MMILAWVCWALGVVGIGVYIRELKKDYSDGYDN